jgi:Biotin-lipoyl like/HlyD family secretion protein
MSATPSSEQWYIHLAARAMQADKPEDLLFSIANETIQLTPYRQAVFFDVQPRGGLHAVCASGLVSVNESSPYTVWLNEFATSLDTDQPFQLLDFEQTAVRFREGWQEWLPSHLLTVALRDKAGVLLGVSLFAREAPWSESEASQLVHLHRTYAYCLAALRGKSGGMRRWSRWVGKSRTWVYVFLALVGLALVPVRLSALANAEVAALDTFSVAAPQDGVVHSFQIQPGAEVKKGDVLFTLDDTSILNRHEIAFKALATEVLCRLGATPNPDALVAEQRAFDDMRGKAALAATIGRVHEKEAELASIKALMARIEIRAEKDGVAIFADASDWIGRPVQTGERVLQLADPKDAGLLIWLPVKDALNIEPGAPVKLFLHTAPLDPIDARIQQTSYQAVLSPDNVASYRLKGVFNDTRALPRIGLRGTARISGQWSILGYYVFRRPVAAIREWAGI